MADVLGTQLLSQFDREKKLFVTDSTPVYTNRILFQNTLMGLALVPYCAREKTGK